MICFRLQLLQNVVAKKLFIYTRRGVIKIVTIVRIITNFIGRW